MTTPEGPTVRRILLGAQLKRLREAQQITREAAAQAVRGSESKISRIESGKVSIRSKDVADLCALYAVTDPEQVELMRQLAEETGRPGWWHCYVDVMPGWFETFVGLEGAATTIRGYEIQFVPGLLQTESYMRAVVSAGSRNARVAEVESRVTFRLTRQQILHRTEPPGPPSYWAVVDEAALHRPIGGTKVMREQIEHLLEITTLPHITLQIMPFRFGAHAGEAGAFSILRFPEPSMRDVVYVEQLGGANYIEKRSQVELYSQVADRLALDSYSPEMTRSMLEKILKQV